MNNRDFTQPGDAPLESEVARQLAAIQEHTVDLLPLDELRTKLRRSLATNQPLRIKQGFDPTTADIHLGHAVGLRKLRQFQDLGHMVVLIIGDYTTLVGDPSGQSATRPQLEYETILANAKTYQEQFFRIVDEARTEVRYNGEWFKTMEFSDLLRLTARYTVARILEREDFARRWQEQSPIGVHELLYPLMQAYDSVAIRADVEIGATEQKFNLLAGRTIQEAYGTEPQCILTLPILVGTDGERKMSKSLGNYIGLTDEPNDMFGKIMSIPDSAMADYFSLAAAVPAEELVDTKRRLADSRENPMNLKKELAARIVELYHPSGSGTSAREAFESVFSKGEIPDEMPTVSRNDIRGWDMDPEALFLPAFLTRAGATATNSEARRLITSGAVTINQTEKVTDPRHTFAFVDGLIIKVGKRRWLKLTD